MSKSDQLFEQARQTIPGGVNSPVRAFNGVGGTPRFIDHADGAYLYDVDGQAYVDYIGSWGPMLLGHNHPAIKAAVIKAVEKGLSYGAPTEIEVLMAEKVRQIVPSMEQVRMVNSGTEATMSAIRLARGYTGRDKIVKFEGCYHGHADSLLVKAGSGALTLGQPNSPGVPADFAALLADHAAMLEALVLATQTLVVLDGAKDLGTEQAVALGLEGAVVDGLGLFNFAIRPRTDLFRRCQADFDDIEMLIGLDLFEQVEQRFHGLLSLIRIDTKGMGTACGITHVPVRYQCPVSGFP